MHGILQHRVEEAREIKCRIMQGKAPMRQPVFGRVCKAIWPFKTAEHLAAAAGFCVRSAAYQISGEHEPSARSVAAIVVARTRRGE